MIADYWPIFLSSEYSWNLIRALVIGVRQEFELAKVMGVDVAKSCVYEGS